MSLPIVSGKLAMIHSSGALETVNVPAGTFDAVPVHEEALFDLRVHYPDGTDQGIVINCESLLYFSENVGPVKIDYLGGTISTSGASWPLAAGVTLELIRYNLPDH